MLGTSPPQATEPKSRPNSPSDDKEQNLNTEFHCHPIDEAHPQHLHGGERCLAQNHHHHHYTKEEIPAPMIWSARLYRYIVDDFEELSRLPNLIPKLFGLLAALAAAFVLATLISGLTLKLMGELGRLFSRMLNSLSNLMTLLGSKEITAAERVTEFGIKEVGAAGKKLGEIVRELPQKMASRRQRDEGESEEEEEEEDVTEESSTSEEEEEEEEVAPPQRTTATTTTTTTRVTRSTAARRMRSQSPSPLASAARRAANAFPSLRGTMTGARRGARGKASAASTVESKEEASERLSKMIKRRFWAWNEEEAARILQGDVKIRQRLGEIRRGEYADVLPVNALWIAEKYREEDSVRPSEKEEEEKNKRQTGATERESEEAETEAPDDEEALRQKYAMEMRSSRTRESFQCTLCENEFDTRMYYRGKDGMGMGRCKRHTYCVPCGSLVYFMNGNVCVGGLWEPCER